MAKPNLLIDGAGGVGQVTANKAVQFSDDSPIRRSRKMLHLCKKMLRSIGAAFLYNK